MESEGGEQGKEMKKIERGRSRIGYGVYALTG